MKKLFILAAVAAMLASCCNNNCSDKKCCGKECGDKKSCKKECCGKECCQAKEIGVQLYSVRDLIGSNELYDANHADVFSKLAQMGYTTVETCWYDNGKFFGHSPEEFKAELEAAGLSAISTHTASNLEDNEVASHDFSAHWDWWKLCIESHKAIGCQYIVVPGFGIPDTLEGLKTYCDYFNEIGKLCAEQGIKFGYHNHSHEFEKLEGTVIYDYMIENTDPQYVFFEMDVYWATRGGVSPVNYFKKYPGRFELLHIKDLAEVGQSGMVGFDAIFKNAEAAGLKHFVVEMEGSGVGDIMETCRISADYLKHACFVKASYAE